MNKLSRYRKLRYNQLFESENRELRLNEMGNPLEVLSQYVDFEIFRPTLESALFTGERKSNADRPGCDPQEREFPSFQGVIGQLRADRHGVCLYQIPV